MNDVRVSYHSVLPFLGNLLFVSAQVNPSKKHWKDTIFNLRKLSAGLPALVPMLSHSEPSIPPAFLHPPVKPVLKEFGLLTEDLWRVIYFSEGTISTCWHDVKNETVEYAAENDVAHRTVLVLRDLISALGLGCKVFSEVGTFGVRPDLWVLTVHNTPVGVVEVKRPDKERKAVGDTILDQTTVLGELYDFALQLPNFYGVQPVFALLTTFETWQVCWLGSEDVDCEAAKGENVKFEKGCAFETPKKGPVFQENSSPPGATPSKKNPKVHTIGYDDVGSDDVGSDDSVVGGSAHVEGVRHFPSSSDEYELDGCVVEAGTVLGVEELRVEVHVGCLRVEVVIVSWFCVWK